jgi:hypothetical protein
MVRVTGIMRLITTNVRMTSGYANGMDRNNE